MKKIIYTASILLLIGVLFNAAFAQNTTFHTNIYFDFGKNALKSEASAKLAHQIDSLRAQNYAIAQIALYGNTDAIGSDVANQLLSSNRCIAVQSFLIQKGIAANRIKTVSKGELAPVADNETNSGRQQNRRVEVEITLQPKAFVNVLQSKSQEFSIQSGVDTLIIGKNGTVFRFRNDVFDVPKGTKLNINIREALTYSDMIFDRLSTVSDGRLLETGGMIKLDVTTQSGNPVAIKAGKTVQIRIPTDKPNHKMQTFYATAASILATGWGLPTINQKLTYYNPEENKDIRIFDTKLRELDLKKRNLRDAVDYKEPISYGDGYCGICYIDTLFQLYKEPKTIPTCIPCYLGEKYKDRIFLPISKEQRLHNQIHDSLATGSTRCAKQWKKVDDLAYNAKVFIEKYKTTDQKVILAMLQKEYKDSYTASQKAYIQRFMTHYEFTNRRSLDSLLATCNATKKTSKWSHSLYAKLYVNTPMDLEAAIIKNRIRIFELAYGKVRSQAINDYFRNELARLKFLSPRIDTLNKQINALVPKSPEEYREAGIAVDSLIKAYNKELLGILHLKSVAEIPTKLIEEDLKRQRKYRDSLYTLYKVKNDRQLNIAIATARILEQQRLEKKYKDSLYTRYQVANDEDLNKAIAAELAVKQKHWRDSMYIKYGVKDDAQLVIALQNEREEKMLQQNTGYYIAEVTQTGWVNMDRFMGMQNLIALKPTNIEGATIVALFKNYKCCLGVSDDVNPYADSKGAPQVPINEAIVLVAYKVKGNKAYFGKKTTTTSTADSAPKMQEITIEELKHKIKELS